MPIKENNVKASFIAYFISKFSEDGIKSLGYKTYKAAFQDIASKIDVSPNYIRLRRDEFDVFTESNRVGWDKREPATIVIKMHNEYKDIPFESYLEKIKIVLSLFPKENANGVELLSDLSENEYENFINYHDESASIKTITTEIKKRVLDNNVINRLKRLYDYKCQICDEKPFDSEIVEGHHLNYFSKSINNDSSNIVILCPNHHRLIHKLNPEYNSNEKSFTFPDGKVIYIKINKHL
jgi:hypothetical protein